ncbi:hypothetical protein H4R18_004414 [Coemansia javaensis]|uniref:Fe2OG dioxygenase domain-containing protein n=1 Tax=Coemansia javaensis TaxID=2761396 RepID=A0A9W8H9I4_9FUNG|nr:hypothetical protein H4R18_004414 [Coemansia javaensis]
MTPKPEMTPETLTAFRRAEKTYMARDPPPSLAAVADLGRAAGDVPGARRLRLERDLCDPPPLPFRVFGQRRPPAYALDAHPGLVVIPAALTAEAQRWLARKCLCDCAQPPNRTNLDPFFAMPPAPLFELAGRAGPPPLVESRLLAGSIDPGVTRPRDPFYARPAAPSDLLRQLRWCTLGWQYNWRTKEYDLGAAPFDAELGALMQSVAAAAAAAAGGPRFSSQAGIINYYDERASMAGHVDRTEADMDAPLVSLSVGLSCVYLIGGRTRDVEPTPLLLRSGDALVMCGESRLAFHGVPRVLPGSAPACLTDPEAGTGDAVADRYPPWRQFAAYLAAHRINCNARKCA